MNDVRQWLMTSIPGLILLGAAGSLLAVIIIRLLNPWLKKAYSMILRIHWSVHVKQVAKQNWILGALSSQDDLSITTVYIIYHIFTFIILVVLSSLALLLLIYRLGLTAMPYLSSGNLALVMLFMLSTYRLVLKFWIFHITYSAHVMPMLNGNASTKSFAANKSGRANTNQ